MSSPLPWPLLLCAGCAGTRTQILDWKHVTAFRAEAKMGGVAIGDFDPYHEGAEMAVVCSTGEVYEVWSEGNGWRSELLHRGEGEMIQCAIGDFDPDHPGDELCFVGMLRGGEEDGGPGAAYVLRREDWGWYVDRVFQEEALIHAVAVGDLDPGHPGEELLLAGYARRAHMLSFDHNVWRVETMASLAGDAKGAAIDGGRAYLACANGDLLLLEPEGHGWSQRVLQHNLEPLARVAARAGDALYCSNDGDLRLLRKGELRVVYHSEDRLRGAVLLDLIPDSPGIELATAGYDGSIVVLSEVVEGGDRHSFTATVVASDTDRIHHLAGGTVGRLGPVLASVGYSGELLVVQLAPEAP